MERSEADVLKAVKKLFKFGTAVVARTATNLVGMGHVLQLGPGTLEGRLARALKDTALQGALAKARDNLVANPADAKALTHFYAAAVGERLQGMEAKKRPQAAAGSGKARITTGQAAIDAADRRPPRVRRGAAGGQEGPEETRRRHQHDGREARRRRLGGGGRH